MYVIPLIVLSLIAAAIILVPYYKSRKGEAGEAPDVAVYKAQLKELEGDIERGIISADEASKSRLEIERRLLKAADHTEEEIAREPINYILLAAMILLVSCSSLLYVMIGNPDMPDFPKNPDQLSDADNQERQKNIDLIAQVNEALVKFPEDARGWAYLANLHMNMRNFQAASNALYKAHLLEPDVFDFQLMYGESLIMAAGERVSPAAKLILNKALKLEPNHPGAKYYLALGVFQAGEVEVAHQEWVTINEGVAADNPLKPLLEYWIGQAERELGRGLPQMRPPSINPEQAEIIQNMDADQQQELIRQMVMQLADKMLQNPGNIEGWLRLSRAYVVLGQKDDAIAAMKSAIEYAPDDQKALLQKEVEKLMNLE